MSPASSRQAQQKLCRTCFFFFGPAQGRRARTLHQSTPFPIFFFSLSLSLFLSLSFSLSRSLIKSMYLLAAYLPPLPEEDTQHLRNRLKQHQLNEDDRKRLMNATFADRRHHAVELRTPMKRLLGLYPMLKNPEEVNKK